MTTPSPALVLLQQQVSALAPRRSRSLDGIMRDPRIGPPSDHHHGNALDLTHDPRNGADVGVLALDLVRQMAGNPVGGRLSYVIWNRLIASGNSGWRWRPYGRFCPHIKHVHISIKATHRHVTRPWTIRLR